MHPTIFDTPVVNTALRALSMTFLRLNGWRVEGSLPESARKSVLIAAPHTSNWDLPYTLMVAFSLRLNIYWMGKHSLFRWLRKRGSKRPDLVRAVRRPRWRQVH